MTDERAEGTESVADVSVAMTAEPNTLLGKLNQQHLRLAESPGMVDDSTVQQIIGDARSLADTLHLPRERATANRIARFWSAVSLERQQSLDTSPDTYLDGAMLSTIARPMGLPEAHNYERPPIPPARASDDRSGAAIQVIAMARRWREAGRPVGYLLLGNALKEARQFVGMDEDVRALVEASDRIRLRGLIALCVFVAMLSGGLIWKVVHDRNVERIQHAENQKALSDEVQEATRARARLEQELSATELALQQQRQLNITLSDQLATLTGKTASQRDPRPVNNAPAPQMPSSTGYDAGFLDLGDCRAVEPPDTVGTISLKLPVAGQDISRFIGAMLPPENLLNFSILKANQARWPLLTASNICRPLLQGVVSRQQPLTALSAEQRAWFEQAGTSPTSLVSSGEIAWGTGSEDAEASAGVPANLVPFRPQAALNWQALRRYAVAGFNPAGAKVSVFAGPILRPDDPVVGGIAVPRAYYIVLAGIRPGTRQELIVESYLLPQELPAPEGIANDDPAARQLLLRATAATLADIEKATGLQFPPEMQNARADGAPMPGLPASAADSPGTRVAATVPGLDSPDQETRRRTTQDLITALRDGGLTAPADQRVTIEALLTLLAVPTFTQISPNARVNLALVLSAIPEPMWQRNDIRLLKARARRAIADIETAVYSEQLPAMPQAFSHFANAKARLGFALGLKRTIDLQFAILPRSEIEWLRSRLQPLGWFLPNPSERTEKASGLNEVRFTAEDQAAGRQLADDIRALGIGVEEKPTTDVAAGTLGVSISKGRAGRGQSSSAAR